MADEETVIDLSRAASLTVQIIPRVTVTLAAPSGDAADKIAHPDALQISVPITGTCANLPAKKYPCKLHWLVLRDGATTPEMSAPIAGEMEVKGTSLEFKVAGQPPKLDLVEHHVFQKGKLGYRLIPDFPRAASYDSAPSVAFNLPLSVTVKPPSSLAFGALFVFEPSMAAVFQKARVHVDIQELDGDTGNLQLSIELQDMLGKPREAEWRIGFANPDCTRFDSAHANQEDEFEYRWTLRVSADGKTFSDAGQSSEVYKVKKPVLSSLEIATDHGWFSDRILTRGQLSGISPDAPVKVKLCSMSFEKIGVTPSPDLDAYAVAIALDGEGKFEQEVAIRWFWQGGRLPDPKQIFMLLSFPALTKGQALAGVLEYNEAKHPGFDGSHIAPSTTARWTCSTEITSLKLEPLIPAPPSYDVAVVTDAVLKDLSTKGPDSQRLAATLTRAKANFKDLLQTKARVVVTVCPGNDKQPVLSVVHATYDPSKPTRIHTHYHGWNSTVAEPMGEISATTKNITTQLKTDAQTVFILPECKSAPTSAATPMAKTDWSNVISISATVQEALAGTGLQLPTMHVTERLLTMHSGGGRALGYAMEHTPDGTGIQVDDIEMQDCMYGAKGGLSCLAGLKLWLKTASGQGVDSVSYFQGTGGNDAPPDAELKTMLGAKYHEKVFKDHYSPLTTTFIHPPPK